MKNSLCKHVWLFLLVPPRLFLLGEQKPNMTQDTLQVFVQTNEWTVWEKKTDLSPLICFFSPKALKERDSVGGNTSRWTASVSKVGGPWLPRDLHTQVRGFSLSDVSTAGRERKFLDNLHEQVCKPKLLLHFKRQPFGRKQGIHMGSCWHLVEWCQSFLKVSIYYHDQVCCHLMLGGMKGGIGWWFVLLTAEVQWHFTCGFQCVWHIVWSALSLGLCSARTNQGIFSAGCTHRHLHLWWR